MTCRINALKEIKRYHKTKNVRIRYRLPRLALALTMFFSTVPTKDSTPLCYTYKAVLDVGAGKKIDFLRRDVRKTGNVKYTGKCVLTKDMDPKEIPVGTSGEFCFCDKDLCNSGPFKAGVARQSVLSMTSLVGSVVLTSTTFIRHYRELVMY